VSAPAPGDEPTPDDGAGSRGLDAPSHQDDPWASLRTAHGFPADELISALQKSIRRGLVENAALVAYELFSSGPAFEDKVWQRLEIISVEDVGLGRIEAPLLVHALEAFRRRAEPESPDRLIYLVHAVRVLALSPKDRTSDELATWVRLAVDRGAARPEVFDDALDMHTRRGQDLGRDFRHWFTAGARVENELPDRDQTYRTRLLKMLEEDGNER
jgi:replication-associated recombination protein RarA